MSHAGEIARRPSPAPRWKSERGHPRVGCRRGWWPLLLLLVATRAPAADPALPVAQQVPLLLKVLTYERTIMETDVTSVPVGFLYDPGNEGSRRQLDEFEGEFRQYADKTLHGHMVTLVPIPLAFLGKEALPPEAAGIRVLYVPPLGAAILPVVREWTRSRKILSVTPVSSFVDAGLTLGLVIRNGRTGVSINRSASDAEGKAWSDDFLRLCHVID